MTVTIYRITKRITDTPLPAGREAGWNDHSDWCQYELTLRRLLIANHISRAAWDVLSALGVLVLQQGEHPTHARLAAAVAAQTGPCSISMVQRALGDGRRLGVVSWDHQYDVAQRRDGRTIPSQTANRYVLHLPDVVPDVPVVRSRLEIQRSRRLHSRDRPPRVGQNEWVGTTSTGLPLVSMVAPKSRADKIAAHLAAQSAANRGRMMSRHPYPFEI